MIALDTNIPIRILMRDDEKQFQTSKRLVENNPVFLSDTVILEMVWVLKTSYGLMPSEIRTALRSTIGLKNIHLEDTLRIKKAIEWYEKGMEFADALHLARCEGMTDFKTFDKKFIAKAKGLTSCRVSTP